MTEQPESQEKIMEKLLGRTPLMGFQKIEELDIDLFVEATEKNYLKARAEYVSELVNVGSSKDAAEAKWNVKYPRGQKDWANNYQHLTSTGQQNVIDKVNELVKAFNIFTGATHP